MVTLPAIRGGDKPHGDVSRSLSGFTSTWRPVAGGICLGINGEVDLANAAELLSELKAVAVNGLHLVIDLGELRYIDTTGARAIIVAYDTFKIYRLRMSLGGSAPTVRKALDTWARPNSC